MMRSIDFVERRAEIYDVRLFAWSFSIGFLFSSFILGNLGFAQPRDRNGRVRLKKGPSRSFAL
jgi:hypothetical protein